MKTNVTTTNVANLEEKAINVNFSELSKLTGFKWFFYFKQYHIIKRASGRNEILDALAVSETVIAKAYINKPTRKVVIFMP